MELLACGHAAHVGGRRICPHLAGEHADELDKAWLMRGVGVEYDLCCAACLRSEDPVELITACEGCVDRADDDYLSVVAVAGSAEVLLRPEPIDPSVGQQELPVPALDLAPVDDRPGEWLLLGHDRIYRWHAEARQILGQSPVRLPPAVPERKGRRPAMFRIIASPGGGYAAVVADYGQYGVVMELSTGREVLQLDRGTGHVEQTPFPAAFTRIDGQDLLVHATRWNRVDLSAPGTGATITARQFVPYKTGAPLPPHYLDYFYGALHPSPDGTWIVADGWIWHPVGAPRLWNLRHWLHENPFEPEDGGSVRVLRYVSYHWNDPMCWLDDSHVAVSGIGHDDDAMIAGVEIFDAATGTTTARFAGPSGPLHSDGRRLYSSGTEGLEAWDPQTGERTGQVPGFIPTRYHPASGQFAALKDNVLTYWPAR